MSDGSPRYRRRFSCWNGVRRRGWQRLRRARMVARHWRLEMDVSFRDNHRLLLLGKRVLSKDLRLLHLFIPRDRLRHHLHNLLSLLRVICRRVRHQCGRRHRQNPQMRLDRVSRLQLECRSLDPEFCSRLVNLRSRLFHLVRMLLELLPSSRRNRRQHPPTREHRRRI